MALSLFPVIRFPCRVGSAVSVAARELAASGGGVTETARRAMRRFVGAILPRASAILLAISGDSPIGRPFAFRMSVVLNFILRREAKISHHPDALLLVHLVRYIYWPLM